MSSLTQRRCHSHRAERPCDQAGNSNFLQDREKKWPGGYFSHITRVRKRLTGKVCGQMQRKVVIGCFILPPDRMTQAVTKSHFNAWQLNQITFFKTRLQLEAHLWNGRCFFCSCSGVSLSCSWSTSLWYPAGSLWLTTQHHFRLLMPRRWVMVE